MGGEGRVPYALCPMLVGGGSFLYPSSSHTVLSKWGRALCFLFCYLEGVIRELEEYPIFSNSCLELEVVRSWSGVFEEGLMFRADDPRARCDRSSITW